MIIRNLPSLGSTFLVACLLFLTGQNLILTSAMAQDNPVPTGSIPEFVESWMQAWQAQDTVLYFSHYHNDFQSSRYPEIEDWRDARIRNISRPTSISINAETLTINPLGNGESEVSFWLVYRAPDYADRTLKRLHLSLASNNRWAILEELNLEVEYLPLDAQSTGSEPPVQQQVELQSALVTEQLPEQEAQLEPQEQPEPQVQELDTPLRVQNSVEENAQVPEEATQNPGIPPLLATPTVAAVDEETESLLDNSPENNQPPVDVARVANPAQELEKEEWVPPGFENLNQPQVTEIDIFYGGFYLTSVLAEFTNSEVTFLERESLIDSLSNLKDPDSFRLLLDSAFDAHPELLCFSDFQVDCGSMVTDSVDVIFDQSRLRLWLFISPDLLLSNNNEQISFLPASEAGLSFLNQSAAFFSGQDSSIENYNLFNNTMFAWHENRLSMRSNLASDEGFEIDTLAFMREFKGKDYRVGLMREDANGFSFMANERFEGVAFASSLLTRTDLEQSLGTEIELFFPTRSRVEIYREGRLISTGYYNVGNNVLDTSAMPNGSYTIEIHVIDAGGNVTIEERFYSKTARIAPADQALYFLHAGRLKNELDVNRLSVIGQDTFIRGGYNLRLGKSLGGSLGVSLVKETTMLEAGLFNQGQNYELQANAAYEDNGASGIDMRMRYRHPKFNLTLNTRQVFNGAQNSQIGLDYNQYYAMLEVPTSKGYLSVFHRDVERPLAGKNTNSGIRFRTRSRDLGKGTLNTNFELSKNGDGVIGLLTFSYQLQGDNRSSVYEPKVSYANADSSRDSGLYGSYQSNWYTGQQSGNEYRLSMRGDYDYENSMEAQFESDTKLGSSDIVARYNGENRNLEFSGRLSTSFASSGETSGFGGKRRSESAFLVRVEGDAESGALFNVLINGVVRGQLKAEETLLLPVSPYQTYEVELKSIGDTLVDLDNRVYQETMYPGNVVNLSWSTRVISIGIGRLVDENNAPLANAVLQNVVGLALTDENGFFQAEIDNETTVLEVLKGQDYCEAVFENPQVHNTVLPLGTLVCR